MEALLELSYPPKQAAPTDEASYALKTVEKYSDPDLAALTRLLEQYEISYKVRTSEHFSSSAALASRLANRINLSRTSKTTQMAFKRREVLLLATRPDIKGRKSPGGGETKVKQEHGDLLNNLEAQRKVEEVAKLMEEQQQEYRSELVKCESEIEVLDIALQSERDERQRKVIVEKRAIAVQESARSVFRAQGLMQQRTEMQVLLRTVSSNGDGRATEELGATETKGTVKQALSRLDSFFPQEAPVPKFIMIGPPRGKALSKVNLKSYMLQLFRAEPNF